MGRRTILLITAVVIAAVGTTLVFLYVNGVDARAQDDQTPVSVLVAKKTITAGTSVSDANDAAAFVTKKLPKGAVLDTALSTLEPIKGDVALSTIYPGEQIITDRFGPPGTAKLSIPDDLFAIAVNLQAPARVAGFVQPGTHVGVWYSTNAGGSGESGLLLSDALVLATGEQTTDTTDSSSAGTDPANQSLTTLAVDQAGYQKLLYASTHGAQLWLSLQGKDATPDPGIPPTRNLSR